MYKHTLNLTAFRVFILQVVKVRIYVDLPLSLNLLIVYTVLLQHLPDVTNHSNFGRKIFPVLF